jgi:hypothetical protein
VVLSVTVLSITSAFSTAVATSAQHRSIATLDARMRNYAEAATYQIELQPNPLYRACASKDTYSQALTNMPTGPVNYNVTLTAIAYWTGSVYDSNAANCVKSAQSPQMLTVVGKGLFNQTRTLSFVVSSFGYTSSAVTLSPTDSLTVAQGTSFSYKIIAGGSPPPTITSTALPSGVTFVDQRDGTAILSGTTNVPAGQYNITISALDSTNTTTKQQFALTITSPPVFVDGPTVTKSVVHGTSNWSYVIKATGVPRPYFTWGPGTGPVPTINALPGWLTFVDNQNGTATISGDVPSGAIGTAYNFTVTANGGAINVNESFTINVT